MADSNPVVTVMLVNSANKVDKNSLAINVQDYPTPQDALDAAPAGSTVFFPPGTYETTSSYVVKADNTTISALGAYFIMHTWATPLFDAIDRSGCIFDIGTAEFVGVRGGVGSSFRGSSGYISGCAVWLNGDRNYVRKLRTINMAVGVFLSSWDGTSTYDRIGLRNRIGDVECSGYNFGVLWTAQDALVIDSIYGHDDLDDSSGTNPTHVYYASGIDTFRSTGVTIGSARADNHIHGQPFQLKFTDQASLTNHTAYACTGLINIIDCHYLSWSGMRGTGLLANSGQGAVTFGVSVTTSKSPNLVNTSIQLASGVDERAVSIIADDAVIAEMTIETNHSAGFNTALNDGILRGNRGRLRGATIRSRGAAHGRGWLLQDLSGSPATNWIIEDPVVESNRGVIDVKAATVGAVIRYNPNSCSLTGAGSAITVIGTPVGGEYTSVTA